MARHTHTETRAGRATLNAQFHQAVMRLLETSWGGDLNTDEGDALRRRQSRRVDQKA
jgi:hypothetical protein